MSEFLDFFPKQVPRTEELESEKTVKESCVTRKNVKTRNVLLPLETQCQRGKIQQSTPWVLHQSSTESFPRDQQFSSKWINIYSQENLLFLSRRYRFWQFSNALLTRRELICEG